MIATKKQPKYIITVMSGILCACAVSGNVQVVVAEPVRSDINNQIAASGATVSTKTKPAEERMKQPTTDSSKKIVSVIAEPKAVYVSAPEAMQVSKKGTEIAKQLDTKRKVLSDSIKAEEQKITQAVAEFKSKETTLSSSARSAEEAKMVKLRRDYETLVKSCEDELKVAMHQASEELTLDIEKTAAELSQEKGYDIVFDIYSGRPVYAKKDALITADLVKAMDSKYDKGSKKSAVA